MAPRRRIRGILVALALALGGAAGIPRAQAAGTPELELAQRIARFRAAGPAPQAIVPLLGALELWPWLRDRGALVRFVDEAAASPTARPEVRAYAGHLRAILLHHLGRPEEARAVLRTLGFISEVRVVGPFEDAAGDAAAQEGPVERLDRPFDPEVVHPGRDHPVRWRRLSVPSRDGALPLRALLGSEAGGAVYLTCFVRAQRGGEAALRLGSSGPVRAWIGTRLVHEREVRRQARPDQDVVAVALVPGWNRLTLRVATEEGAPEVYLRLTALDGSPLPGLKASVDPALAAAAARARAPSPRGRPSDLERELGQRAQGSAPAAEALADLGLYLHHFDHEPTQRRAVTLLSQAAELAPSADRYLQLAAAETDANERRGALELGLARLSSDDPERARLLVALGDLERAAGRNRRAEARWREALSLADGPGPLSARLRMAELAGDRGLPARASALYRAIEQQHPCLRVWQELARLALRRGRRAEAERWYRRLLDEEADDDEALRELASLALARGETDDALAWLDRLARARPERFGIELERADVLEDAGRGEAALEALDRATLLTPDEPRLLERAGRLLVRLGRKAEGLERLRRSLELRPQSPELRGYVAALELRLARAECGPAGCAEAGAELARRYAADPRALARDAPPPRRGEDPARVLMDLVATRVHSNGLSESFHQRTVQIFDERGAREQGAVDIAYTPSGQVVEVIAARVFKASGEVVQASETEDADLSEPWYGLYYDLRAQVIRFPALGPGDIVDVQYVVSDVERRNQLATYYGDLYYFQEELPRVESRYVLIAPKARALYFNQPRLAGLKRTEEVRGEVRVFTYAARDLQRIVEEPGMPGRSEVSAYLHVSTYRDWREVAAWYGGLVREQLRPGPVVRQAALDAVRGITDERAKIRAVYDLVVRSTRYVALEFGIHRYKPYRVAQVFQRKFGDCKDKASLLVAMLGEVGIEATLALVRTRRGGDLDAAPASLAAFDHAIAWVPKYDLYLDGTAEFSGAEELPAQDQDVPVLIVSTGELRRTPVSPAPRNLSRTDWRVRIDAEGDALVDERLELHGEAAPRWREHYQAPGERAARYQKAFSAHHPGARLERVEMPGVDDLERPVEVRASFAVPSWARTVRVEGRNALAAPILGREPDLLRSYARLSKRDHDLLIGYPFRQEQRIEVELPPGWIVRRLPPSRRLTSELGSFSLETRAEATRVVVSAGFELGRHRVGRAAYPAFRAFLTQVDAVMAEELVLEPAPVQGASR